jgi:hypothetical protein
MMVGRGRITWPAQSMGEPAIAPDKASHASRERGWNSAFRVCGPHEARGAAIMQPVGVSFRHGGSIHPPLLSRAPTFRFSIERRLGLRQTAATH